MPWADIIATVQIVNAAPFRNPFLSLDVSRDGSISPLDALIVVNRLNKSGPGELTTPTSVTGLTEFFYLDTNGDQSIAPVDVLRIINFLNGPTGDAEREAGTSVEHAFVDTRVNRTLTTTFDQEDNSSELHISAAESRSPVPARSVAPQDARRSTKTLTPRAEDEELKRAIDEIFGDFAFGS